MGYSLENHIAALLDAHEVAYVRGAVTEHNNKPDFLFPNLEAYRMAAEGDLGLTFLGAKSSCRDRWRQVLTEAEKIPHKHLLTLQTNISQSQTDQMAAASVQLVVPQKLHTTFTDAQQDWLMSVSDFIMEVQRRNTSYFEK